MIKAKGNGLSECFLCKCRGLYSLTWTSFYIKLKMMNIYIVMNVQKN